MASLVKSKTKTFFGIVNTFAQVIACIINLMMTVSRNALLRIFSPE